jgi:hypothetical protein
LVNRINMIDLYWDVLAVAAPFRRRALDDLEYPALHQHTRRALKNPRREPVILRWRDTTRVSTNGLSAEHGRCDIS